MSHYDFCCQHVGRPVKIVTSNGEVHKGIIRRVNPSKVFIAPLGQNRGLGGYGYGYYGYRRGYPWGLGLGIALGAIATIAFLPPFFFW
ncbi:hypothetical protein JCM21714_1085 [Gracilibacillus boraciitolerans JCM 21714]|uniref:Uncharacterized protein n=1 Tax=Gracilibacillus boraciitolerans JCM 21714 TaxID=1298598 RepID=W4VH68_9BACI|nr:hypothetical protein [Gracilibacillus boraciitolerans]GAE92104.1 hypothetical protein JCM21714_1085 [Gracilibacillus boraciitolerans JCM 21714]